MKKPKVDWSSYEAVPFAVLIHSGVMGWLESTRPKSAGDAWRSYEAMDSKKKMLLNYGLIIAEQ
jgi:hypothetical protein